jgi:dynein light intermediate chain
MIPPNTSLVKYDNPVLISKTTDKKSSAKVGYSFNLRTLIDQARIQAAQMAAASTTGPLPPATTSKSSNSLSLHHDLAGKLAPLDATQKAQQATEDILGSIIPPREFTDNGQLWVQQVSSAPATRLDVITLQVCLFFGTLD